MAYAFDYVYSDEVEDIFKYLRIVFTINDLPSVFPAIYCKDYFAEEIQAEASG